MWEIPEELYNKMLDEIFGENKKPKFDTMAVIVDKLMSPAVARWCRSAFNKRAWEYQDDMLQDILLRVMQTSVTYFFLHGGRETPNDSAEDFSKWTYTVSLSVRNNFLKKYGKELSHRGELGFITDKDSGEEESETDALENVDSGDVNDSSLLEARERLNSVFSSVMSFRSKPYIILTWMGVHLIELIAGMNQREAIDEIDCLYSDRTLKDFYDFVCILSDKRKWIEYSPEAMKQLGTSLGAAAKGDKTFAESVLKCFYMEGGAQRSMCDWINKTNKKIRGDIENGNEK